MSIKEILRKFEISDEQAEDSECEGDSEAEDGTSSKRTEKHVSRKRRKMASKKEELAPKDTTEDTSPRGQSHDQTHSPVPGTSAGTLSDVTTSTSGATSEELSEGEGVEKIIVTPRIDIHEIIPESSSETSSSEETDSEVPKWEKDSRENTIKQHFDRHRFDQPFGSKTKISTESLLSIFLIFFNNDLLENIVEQSNLYANQKGYSLNFYRDELCCFIGILIIMGFHQLPSIRLYWSTNGNLGVPRISQLMTLKRFLTILRYFHLNDNSLMPARGAPEYDKLYKIRPFLNHFLTVFKNAFSPSQFLAIDECTISHKGRSTLKQYIPMKPIKGGFKIWAICCSVTGYLLGFDFYYGKSVKRTTSLGEKVVLHLIRGFEGLGYCLFFNRFFSSFPLIRKLLNKGFYACATISQTRKYFPKSFLSTDKALKFGEIDYCHCGDFGVVKWKGKGTKCVCVVSSMDDPQKTTIVHRKNKMGEKIPVDYPESINSYNKYMGGVDMFDQYMSSYTTQWKSRRWWINTFYYFLDASIVNAYILYKVEIKQLNRQQTSQSKTKKPLDHLMFRSKLADELILNFCSRKVSPKPIILTKKKFSCRPTLSVVPPIGHLPRKCKQRRCALCSTKKNPKRTTIECDTCQVGLCLKNCFKEFHDSMK